MRSTRAHTGNRRSHHALMGANLALCPKCSAPYKRHMVCSSCGFYKGVEKINILAKTAKKTKKKAGGAVGGDKTLGGGK